MEVIDRELKEKISQLEKGLEIVGGKFYLKLDDNKSF